MENDRKLKFSVPKLKPKLFCGLSNDVQGNIHYIKENLILHPIGRVMVLDNLETKSQDYIKLPANGKTVNILTVSPNRSVIGVGEKGEKPTVAIYDLETKKRLKYLGNPIQGCTSRQFEALCFTHDGDYLVGLVGDPDWILLHYNWRKGKVESTFKAGLTNQETRISKIACHPDDRFVVVIVGIGYFKLVCCTDNVWRQYGFQRAESLPLTSVAWLTKDILLTGARDGRLILIQSSELRAVYKSTELQEINVQKRNTTEEEVRQVQATLASNLVTDEEKSGIYEPRSLESFSNGFAFSCLTGEIYVYHKIDTNRWIKKNIVSVKGIIVGAMDAKILDQVHDISFSPCERKMLVTTRRTCIYQGEILVEQNFEQPCIKFEELFNGFHQGPIGAISVCLWKPLFLTIGSIDRSCRIWNYKTTDLILIKDFPDEIYSAAFHPTGFYCLLGFTDKLKMLIILINDMIPVRYVDIKGCSLVQFARGGHIFAAVNGLSVELYSAVNFEKLHVLTGHLGPIRSVCYVFEDNFLYTCGQEGSLYKWDLKTGERIEDIYTKYNGNFDIAAKRSGEFVYTVGTDGTLKEICKGEITRKVDLNQYSLYAIVLSTSDDLMFLGGEKNTVVSVVYPLVYPPAYKEFPMHSNPIKYLLLTYDDEVIVSVSEEGSLCLWEVKSVKAKKKKRATGEFSHVTQVVVGIDEWTNQLEEVKELRVRLDEVEGEHSYVTKQVAAAHQATLKEIHQGYLQTIDELKSKIKQTEREHLLEVHNYNVKLEEGVRDHSNEIEAKEKYYAAKLIDEYDRFDNLVKTNEEVEKKYKKKIKTFKNAFKNVIKDMIHDNNETLNSKEEEIKELQNKVSGLTLNYDAYKNRIEKECDQEIIELKSAFNHKLASYEENMKEITLGNGMTGKLCLKLENEIEKYKTHVSALESDLQSLKKNLSIQTKEIDALKREIDERDRTIAKKDELVIKLSKRNETYSKEKYVKDIKLESTRLLMKPLEVDKDELERRNNKLELEIRKLLKTIDVGCLNIANEKRRTLSLLTQLGKTQTKIKMIEKILKNILNDIYKIADVSNEPRKLHKAFKDLYSRYILDITKKTLDRDLTCASEIVAQREQLERLINQLYWRSRGRKALSISRAKVPYAWICKQRVKNYIAEVKRLKKMYELEKERSLYLDHRLKSFENSTE